MRSLLDVNVLVALLDPDHDGHGTAVQWLAGNLLPGWATCPLTQLGCLRVLSQATYPRAFPLAQVAAGLHEATSHAAHAFWADDVPAVGQTPVDPTRVHGPAQLTDVYLLALAVRHGGRLVTLDRRIARSAVRGAEPHHLVVL